VDGAVPATQAFVAVAFSARSEDELFITAIEFCGDLPDISRELAELEADLEREGISVRVDYLRSPGDCEGGETYSRAVDLPVGVTTAFSIERLNLATSEAKVLAEGAEVLDEDRTNSAAFDFGDLPDTGGSSGGGLALLGSVAALVALGVFTARRAA
jgi:LPXTG-motif cell wall-anchored protein